MDREGAPVTCDGRLFHRRAAATGTLCRRQWTDEYVEHPDYRPIVSILYSTQWRRHTRYVI